MDALGITDIPLGYGQDSPLAGNNEFPEWVRQAGNGFWGLPIPNADKTYPVQTAPELMVSIINQSPVPVTIFVSGPATNLAQALQLDPNIKNNIAGVYMMGGAVYVAGNIDDLMADHDNKVAEWNIFGDPQAANIVVESGVDFHLIPLDATNQVYINKQDISQWRQGGEVADFAADIYDMVLNNQGGENGKIWDVMTAVIMINPDLCRFQPLHLQVITQVGSTSGQTSVIPGEAANVSVCLEPDVDGIRQTLIDVYSGNRNSSISSSNLGPASVIVTASTSLPDSPPINAMDNNSESIWNAGADPEQWIQIDLGKLTEVSAIRLVISQYPAGNTIHQIWGSAEVNNLTLLNEFNGFTQDHNILEFNPPIPLSNIRYIKITTTQSPSWVAWREIEVISP
jgi:inosine-uridine nucleoside N-ribohydrolase